MSGNDELVGGGGGGDDGSVSADISLGDASDFVDGSSADWIGLVTFLLTIPVLIVADSLARFVAGVFEILALAVNGVGTIYAELNELAIGVWPRVFTSAFNTASESMPELGPAGFVFAVVVIGVWFLVLGRLVEVL